MLGNAALAQLAIAQLPSQQQQQLFGGKSILQQKLEQYAQQKSKILAAAQHMSSLGGHARAKALTPQQRTTIASNAALTRWR